MRIKEPIPITVVEYDGVRRLQVDTQPAGARGQQEDELGGVGRVVRVHRLVAVHLLGRPVDPTVLKPTVQAVVLQQ